MKLFSPGIATNPPFAIARNISVITLTLQDVNTITGVLTDSTSTLASVALFGHLESIELETQVETENISAMNSPFMNKIPIEGGTTLRGVEIEKYTTAPGLVAQLIYIAANLGGGGVGVPCKYVVTRSGKTWTGYGVFTNYKMNNVGKGRVQGSFTIEPIAVDGIGSAGTVLTYA